jgi:hypothetical protein
MPQGNNLEVISVLHEVPQAEKSKIKYSDENIAVNVPGGHIQDRRSGMRNLSRTTAAMERVNAQKYNLIIEQVHIIQECQL